MGAFKYLDKCSYVVHVITKRMPVIKKMMSMAPPLGIKVRGVVVMVEEKMLLLMLMMTLL